MSCVRDVVGSLGAISPGLSNPAVELRITRQLPVEAGHAHQDDHAEVGAVEVVADLFEAVDFSLSASSMMSSSVRQVLGVTLEFRVVVRAVQS
jgi:hypothetical protein